MTREGITVSPHATPLAVDLNEVLRKACKSEPIATDPAFILDFAEDLPNVSVDPGQIGHVVSILIANAKDAIDANLGRPGEITVKTSVHNQRIHLTVTDNGRGIHCREMGHLFGDQSRDVVLTHCAEIVKDLGGDLYAWSSYGNGSVFTLELPIQGEIAEQKFLFGKRILVIDDEIQISTLMSDVLQQEGAQIDLANSGVQAVERIKSKRYDLLICDQQMPDLNGERLYRSVESMNPELRWRFLFVTGDVLNEETDDFFNQTGVRFIRKPFRSVELVEAAEQVLSRTQQLGF
jgi:CheY-like chemotaxis protein